MPAAFAKKGPESKKQERNSNRPGITLDRLVGAQHSRLLLVHGDDPFLVDDRGGILTIRKRKSSRYFRNFVEAWRIQLGIDRTPVLIPDKIITPLLRLDWDQRSRSRTESDREDPDSRSLRFLGRFDTALIKLLSIRHQHKCPAHCLPLAEGCDREPDRRSDVGASLWNRVRIEIVDGGQDGPLV